MLSGDKPEQNNWVIFTEFYLSGRIVVLLSQSYTYPVLNLRNFDNVSF